MSLKKNLSLIYLVYFSRASVFLLLLPLLVRRLDETWGVLAVLLGFIQLAATAIEFGFGVSATKQVAEKKDNEKILISVLLSQALLFLIISIIAIPIVFLLNLGMASFFIVVFIILFMGMSPLWYFRGIEDIALISVLEVVSKIFVLGIVWFWVIDGSDLNVALFAYLVGVALPTVLGYVVIIKNNNLLSKEHVSKTNVINQLKEGSTFFGVRLSGMFVSVGGSMIVGLMGNSSLAGQFAIAERVISGIRSILFPAWDVVFPRLVNKFAEGHKNSEKFRMWSNLAMIGFALLTSIVLYVLAEQAVLYFSGGIDESTVLVVEIMSVSPLIVAIINSLGLSYLVAENFNLQFFKSILFGSIIYFIFLVVFSLAEVKDELFYISWLYVISLFMSMLLIVFYIKNRSSYGFR